MRKLILILFILLALVLAACQSSTPTEVVEATAKSTAKATEKAVNTQPPEDISSQEEVSEPTATKALEDASANETAVRAKCTVESRDPTPGPTEESLFAPVSDADWIRGPDNAAVTIIEYSDFQ